MCLWWRGEKSDALACLRNLSIKKIMSGQQNSPQRLLMATYMNDQIVVFKYQLKYTYKQLAKQLRFRFQKY